MKDDKWLAFFFALSLGLICILVFVTLHVIRVKREVTVIKTNYQLLQIQKQACQTLLQQQEKQLRQLEDSFYRYQKTSFKTDPNTSYWFVLAQYDGGSQCNSILKLQHPVDITEIETQMCKIFKVKDIFITGYYPSNEFSYYKYHKKYPNENF